MIDLDRRVGTENFPDVPDYDPQVFVKFAMQVGIGWNQAAQHMQAQLYGLAQAVAKSKIQTRKGYVLWPPELQQLQHKPKRKRGPDHHVPPKHPVFHNTPDFNNREAIRNLRSKQASLPIGRQGCGFVWNRGRLSQ